MKKRRKKKIFRLFFVLFIFFLIFIIYFYNENLLNLKSLSTSIFNIVYEEYPSQENTQILELEQEIKDLKEINNINNEEYNYLNCKIILRNNSFWNESITINVGKKNNIKKGSAVTYKGILIGIVNIVNNSTSSVKLITSNKENYISAKFSINDKEYFGIIKKYNPIKNELYLENVIGDFEINNEDVITSGLDGNIPSGIYIGKIKGIEKDKYNLSSKIIIEPTINYNNIKYVKVYIK